MGSKRCQTRSDKRVGQFLELVLPTHLFNPEINTCREMARFDGEIWRWTLILNVSSTLHATRSAGKQHCAYLVANCIKVLAHNGVGAGNESLR